MKGLYFTDIHFGRRNNSKEHNEDCFNFVTWAISKAKEHNVDFIGFLGDWFENRNAIDVSTLNIAYEAAKQLSLLGVPVYFCIGNHDLYKRYSREHFSTVHYNDIDNFVIVDKPIVANNILFCPFLFEEEYDSLSQYSNIPVWAGHFEFEGFSITSYNTKKEGGPSHKAFKDVELILSGHFHKRQTMDNTTYIGNVFPMDFSDVHDTERGICIIDHDDNVLHYTSWEEQPTYHKVKLSELQSHTFPPKSRIKSLIDIDIPPEELMSIKQALLATGVREILFEEQKLDLTEMFALDEDEKIDVSEFSTLQQLIHKMIEKIDDVNVDNQLLLSILEKSGEFDSFNSTSEQLRIKQLKFQNFYSYGNNITTVDFANTGKFNLIYGENNDVVYDDNDKCKSGTGKAQPLDAKIKTPYGWTTMGDINPGDIITNVNGAPICVLDTFPQGVKDIFTITMADGRQTEACGEHLWNVMFIATDNDLEKIVVLSTDEISELLQSESNEYKLCVTLIQDATPNIELPIEPFLYGLSLMISANDVQKHFDCMMLSGTKQRQMLLTGVFQVRFENITNNISYHTENIEYAEFVAYIIRSLGKIAEICLIGHTYTVTMIVTNNPHDCLEIKSIIPCGKKEAKCILVDDPSHLYITDDFIVTHNTTIANGLAYCFYDRVIKDGVTFDDIINNVNKVNMFCELIFQKGSSCYKITRRRKFGKNKVNDVMLHLVDPTSFDELTDLTKDSSSNTNKFIKDIIGLQFETFTRMVLFTASNTSFFALPVTSSTSLSQTDILEDLFRLKELTVKADNIKKYQKTIKELLLIETKVIEQREKTNNQKIASIENLKANIKQWEIKRTQDIKIQQELLAKIPHNIEQIITDTAIYEVKKRDLIDLNNVIDTIERELKQSTNVSTKLEQEISALSKSICPYCKQSHTDNAKLSKLEQQLILENQAIDEMKLLLNDEMGKIDAVSNEATKYAYVEKQKNCLSIFKDQQLIVSRIESLEMSKNPFEIAFNAIDETMDIIDYDIMNKYKQEIVHCDFMVKLLTKKDSFVRKALLKQNLPFLNTRINEYLSALKLPHLVYFTDELLTKIELKGREFSFSTISNGQIARVNIALCLAFRDIIARMHSSIDILLLDECLDTGLSSNGVANTIKLIRQKADQDDIKIFIITHREEITHIPFHHKIKVIYANNFSTLTQQDEQQ